MNSSTAVKFWPPALVSLIALLLAGCAHHGWRRTGEPARFLEDSRRRFEDSRSPYQTTGRISFNGPSSRYTLDFSLRWESSIRSRIDLSGPLGLSLASAAVADTLAWLSVPMAGLSFRGSVALMDSEAVQRLGFPVEAFFKYLEGWPPMATGVVPKATDRKGLVEYRYDFNDTTLALFLDRGNGMPRKLSASASGRPFLEATFGDHRRFNTGLRPHRLTLSAPARELRLEVEFDELRPAKSFPPATWLPPEGSKTE